MTSGIEPNAVSAAGSGAADAPMPICTWEIPRGVDQPTLTLEAFPGDITAILGSNGSGKSALGFWMQTHAGDAKVARVIAHRRLWLEHARPDITPNQREDLRTNIKNWSNTSDSRWRDHAQASRPGMTLYDLLRRENERNAGVARLHDEGKTSADIDAVVSEAPFRQINRVLAQANLEILIEVSGGDNLEAIHARRGVRYPITEMSDGEKSAVLLVADILTQESGSVQIIDEPERHLHRSISAALIAAAIRERPDCHFVLLTHDLDLAHSLPQESTTLAVVTDSGWSGTEPSNWEIHALDQAAEISDTARRAILGGRRKILFVEGDQESLDHPLYSVLFPDWSIHAAGGCESVIRSVAGLQTSSAHHWIEPRGIVDGDGRTSDEVSALADKGILSLPVQEVESLYYSAPFLAALAKQMAEVLGGDSALLLDQARKGAIDELTKHGNPERLSAIAAKPVLQRRVLDQLGQKVATGLMNSTVTIEVKSTYPELLAEYRTSLDANNLDALVRSFPIRDSGTKVRVSDALRFKTVDNLEHAARTLIARDPQLAQAIRDIVGELPTPRNSPGPNEALNP